MRRAFTLLALVLPLVVYGLSIYQAERALARGEVYTFAITGYDPRDLLRGHYLRFEVAFDWSASAGQCRPGTEAGGDQDCCLCLTKNETPIPEVSRALCAEARARCDGMLRESAARALERYYIPEARAAEAERLIREGWASGSAHILVSVTPDGDGQIVDLTIGGRSLGDLLAEAQEDGLSSEDAAAAPDRPSP